MPKAQVNGVYWYYERKIHHEITPLYGNLCYFCVLSGVVHDFLFITFIPQMQSMQEFHMTEISSQSSGCKLPALCGYQYSLQLL